MSSQYKDFFDLPSQESAPSQVEGGEDFFDIPTPEDSWVKPEAPPIKEQLKNVPGLISREAATDLYSAVSTGGETYRFLADKLRQYGEDLAAKEGRELTPEDIAITDKFVNYIPDLIQSLNEK